MAERPIVNLNKFNIPYGQVPMAKSEKNSNAWNIHPTTGGPYKTGKLLLLTAVGAWMCVLVCTRTCLLLAWQSTLFDSHNYFF